jgi:hypothetical protein
MRSVGGLVLLRPRSFGESDPGTVALAARTGAARWHHPGSLVFAAGSPTVLAVSEVRSLSGTGRRVEGPVEGVDLDTGRTRWTVPVPSTAVLTDLPGTPSRGLLVHDSGAAELRDLVTGAVIASTTFPPADYGPGNPGIAEGAVLLRHQGAIGTQITAYDPVTLQRRWSRSERSVFEVQPCGRLACLVGRRGVLAVDPHDGTDRWYRYGWRNVEQRGGVLLAYGQATAAGDLVGLVDPDTGRVTVDLRSWRPVAGQEAVPGQVASGRLLVARDAHAGAGAMVAVADPAAGRPRLLGELPPGTGDCRAVPGRLVCRSVSGKLVLWSYSEGGGRAH